MPNCQFLELALALISVAGVIQHPCRQDRQIVEPDCAAGDLLHQIADADARKKTDKFAKSANELDEQNLREKRKSTEQSHRWLEATCRVKDDSVV